MALGSLRILRNRNYALLWGSGLISDAGTWMQAVAVGALVTDLTDSAAWGGLVAGVSYLTSGIVTPFGGVIADRRDRRRLLLWLSIFEAALAFGLAVLYVTDHISPAVLTAMVAIEWGLLALGLPARGAMLPDIVDKEDLVDATSMGIASWNLGRLLGPAAAGTIIAVGSYSWVFIINAVSFLFVAIAMAFIRVRPSDQRSDGSVWERLREGARAARANDACWSAIRTIAVTAVFVSPFIALVPAMAQLVFDGDAVDTAHFVMAQGIGSVVGAFILSPLARRIGYYALMTVTLVFVPVVEMAYAVAPTKMVAMILLGFLGVGYVWILAGLNSIVQLHAPANVRARILSFQFMTLSVFYPFGATIQGWLGDKVGIRQTLFVGPLIFLIVFAVVAVVSPRWLRSLDAPRKEPETVTLEEATP